MTRRLHKLALGLFISTFSFEIMAQPDVIAGDPIAFGQTMPGYDLLAELTEARVNPKIYRVEENLDLDIKASALHLDLSKEKKIEFSARSEWATNYVWKFGDGSTTSGFQHVQHEYKQPGSYEVTVLATSNKEVAKQTIKVVVVDKSAALELEEMEHFYVFPADNKLEADFQLNLPKKEKHLTLEMKDITGSRIYQFEIGKVRRKQKIHVDLQNLEPGKYYSVLKGKRYSLVSMIIVAR
ncbi:MAG: PKD domain-containing protein [Bacteroidia bacterium]